MTCQYSNNAILFRYCFEVMSYLLFLILNLKDYIYIYIYIYILNDLSLNCHNHGKEWGVMGRMSRLEGQRQPRRSNTTNIT